MDNAFGYYPYSGPTDEQVMASTETPQLPGHTPTPDWLWGSTPISPGSLSQLGFAPYALPQVHERPPLDPNPSSSSRSSYDILLTAPKVAIPRATSLSHHSQRRRSARACEPCRQRKIKCDGNKPACRQCLEQNVQCNYVDVKRVRDQKQLSVLARKVQRYEKLLEEIEREIEGGIGRRIRRALRASDQMSSADEESYGSEDETTSMGSLEEIDLVEEDLNRNAKSIATGFFGKNSEVSWMQRLEDEAESHTSQSKMDDVDQHRAEHSVRSDVPIAAVSYHLDDLNIPFLESVDPYALPPRDVADQYFAAYMESVHPSFMVIRKETYTAQYRQFFSQPSRPPRRWLAILNMIFAIGCRYCRFTSKGGDGDSNDLIYLNRARKLSLSGNVLFEHADLQQIQVEFLAAFYLITTGQVNRAFKLSSLAFRSALALGINLRFVDNRVHHASKEARSRLWWSIYLLEHLLTAVTGRVACVGEGLSSTPLPLPFEEDQLGSPEVANLFQDPTLRLQRLKMTLLQTDEEARDSAEWLATCPPSASLIFHCLVDLVTITQAIINRIYSIQGLREHPSRLEQRIRKYDRALDTWRSKLPQCCRFTDGSHSDQLRLDASSPFLREKVRLALAFYSSRVILCRPCITTGSNRGRSRSNSHSHSRATSPSRPRRVRGTSASTSGNVRSRLRTEMSLMCLQSACRLIAVLPDTPDIMWLTRCTPWWSILHYVMQATTALLLGIFNATSPTVVSSSTAKNPKKPSTNHRTAVTAPGKREVTIDELMHATQKAFHWLHAMSQTDTAARRAFVLCDSFIRRSAPSMGLDISGFPDGEGMGWNHGAGGGSSNSSGSGLSSLEGWEEWLA